MAKSHKEYAESLRNTLREYEEEVRRQHRRERGGATEAELYDIQKELEAKFDDLFGNIDSEDS